MKILSIESSCDETAAAITEGREVLASAVYTQIEIHSLFGGVVPEIASRKHIEAMSEIMNSVLQKSNLTLDDIDAVAVTFAPGLIGALLVGVNFAKGLALSMGVPLIPVHHLRSHIAANYIDHPELEPPFLCLLVSGGNTMIVEVRSYTDFRVIGQTRDDAVGECYDKAARAMGHPYPGGSRLDYMADQTLSGMYKLPRPKISDNKYDFSFSGLKTFVVNLIHNTEQRGEPVYMTALAADLINRVTDILVEHTMEAAEEFGYRKIALAGGVAANSVLRKRLKKECEFMGYELYIPECKYCGDNAAMVGVQAFYEYLNGNTAGTDLNASATLPIDYL